MNKKKLRTACITSLCLLLLLLQIGLFIFALQEHTLKGFVTGSNSHARNHYVMLTSDDIINLADHVDIPTKGTFYLTGECNDFQYYKVYANDIFPQDTVIFGRESDPNGYWGIQITDGNITAAWDSNYPLNITQLSAYTPEEQLKQIHLFDLFENFSESKVIGYYCTDE